MGRKNKKRSVTKGPVSVPADQPDPEIQKILDEHKEWLSSNGKYGKRAKFKEALGLNFASAQLQEADLEGVNFILANLDKADLRNADLRYADFGMASLVETNLEGADMKNATLSGANFFKANLTNAILDNVYGFGTNFQDANLTGASFRGALLDHTKLTDNMECYVATLHLKMLEALNRPFLTNINQKQLQQARGDCNTKLPGALSIEDYSRDDNLVKT